MYMCTHVAYTAWRLTFPFVHSMPSLHVPHRRYSHHSRVLVMNRHHWCIARAGKSGRVCRINNAWHVSSACAQRYQRRFTSCPFTTATTMVHVSVVGTYMCRYVTPHFTTCRSVVTPLIVSYATACIDVTTCHAYIAICIWYMHTHTRILSYTQVHRLASFARYSSSHVIHITTHVAQSSRRSAYYSRAIALHHVTTCQVHIEVCTYVLKRHMYVKLNMHMGTWKWIRIHIHTYNHMHDFMHTYTCIYAHSYRTYTQVCTVFASACMRVRQ
jgi:hypothetical protein